MPAYRSRTTTHGRNMAGARGLWRATGMKDGDFGKPIIAVVNSFTQFVPGHVHLKDLGQLVAREIEAAGGVAKEFNTIAVDDGIAMGHDGMLYSLPSRELIADAVEYMVNAHCADAMVCISNCDKITPGMLMAAMRLNIPAVFVSGGPMEAGKVAGQGQAAGARPRRRHGRRPPTTSIPTRKCRRSSEAACPTCGSCSGMFTANSMNCLTEALGLSLPGNGSTLATHADRKRLFVEAGHLIVDLARRYYEQDDATALPRSIATEGASRTPWRSTSPWAARPTPCCTSSPPPMRAASTSPWTTSTRFTPQGAGALQGRAGQVRRPHGGRPPRRRHHGDPRRARPRRPDQPRRCRPSTPSRIGDALDQWDISRTNSRERCATSSWPRPAACAPRRRLQPVERAGTSSTSTARPA